MINKMELEVKKEMLERVSTLKKRLQQLELIKAKQDIGTQSQALVKMTRYSFLFSAIALLGSISLFVYGFFQGIAIESFVVTVCVLFLSVLCIKAYMIDAQRIVAMRYRFMAIETEIKKEIIEIECFLESLS